MVKRFAFSRSIIPVAAFALIVATGPATACICVKEPRQQVIDDADVAFIGIPVEITKFKKDGQSWEKTTFRVEKWIKGNTDGGLTADIHIRRSGCDIRFKEETGPFTVAAFADENGRFTTNRCVMLNIHRDQ